MTKRVGALYVDVVDGKVYREVGDTMSNGYRRVTIAGKQVLVHRLVWETAHGPVPPGWHVNHLNGVKDDNRLENLEACSAGDNLRHAYRTELRPRVTVLTWPGRHDSDSPHTKIPAAAIPTIMERYRAGGISTRALAAEYGVSQSTMWKILKGRRWSPSQATISGGSGSS